MQKRNLTDLEIVQLEKNGCRSDSWNNIVVNRDFFDASHLQNVIFSGPIAIGRNDGEVEIDNSIVVKSGIYNAYISNCEIGDNCYIRNIGGFLSGYVIESNVAIVDCGNIVAEPNAKCGFGTTVSVINEAGGREVPLFDKLTSNVAHMIASYRYRTGFIDKILAIVSNYISGHPAGGRIESNARLSGCKSLSNISVGAYATLKNVASLVDGTILSCSELPTYVGTNVIAKHFIFKEGACVDNAAILERCFIGQCSQIGNGFFAENTLVFSNCQLFNGEAVSAFAGPFTVSHHKTTLLIAAEYSFYNAGSATNKSNHHYKLGPTHQAVFERGVKTGSGCYLLEPAYIGAYTMVVGHHKGHPDTTEYPFSYLVERGGDSFLMAAQNLKTIGLFRDEQKWLSRDARPTDMRFDKLTPSVMNPKTVGTMLASADAMNSMAEKAQGDVVIKNGVRMQKTFLPRAAKAYRQAALMYLMEVVANNNGISNINDLPQTTERWIDFGGLIAPQSKIEELISNIENDRISTIDEVLAQIETLSDESESLTYSWCVAMLKQYFDVDLSDNCAMHNISEQWLQALTDWQAALIADAKKEFAGRLNVGYGLDSETDMSWNDFYAVKGTFDKNPSVVNCNAIYDEKIRKAKDFIISLDSLKKN